jgi:hypothetical protein
MQRILDNHILKRMLPPSELGISYYFSRGDELQSEIILDRDRPIKGQCNVTFPVSMANYDSRKLSKSPFEVKPRELLTQISA